MAESYNRTLVVTTAAMLLIPQSVGVLAGQGGHHWWAGRSGKATFYAAAWIDVVQVQMNSPRGDQANRGDGNGLENRRENLRRFGRTDGD